MPRPAFRRFAFHLAAAASLVLFVMLAGVTVDSFFHEGSIRREKLWIHGYDLLTSERTVVFSNTGRLLVLRQSARVAMASGRAPDDVSSEMTRRRLTVAGWSHWPLVSFTRLPADAKSEGVWSLYVEYWPWLIALAAMPAWWLRKLLQRRRMSGAGFPVEAAANRKQ